MDLSLFFELETSDLSEAGIRRTFDQCIEQTVLADQLGYRAVWFTEHHFLPGFSYSSSPELVLAHLAARTKNIRLGHGIVLLPFRINHPLRVAERIATLDVLSNGRVEFGGGRAISESELSGFEVDPDVTRAQWEESLRILPQVWTQENFQYSSPTLKIPERQVVPKPVQKPHPPMWVACTQPATVEFAGDNGLGVLGFGIGQGQSNDFVQTYRERIKNCKPIGSFVNNKFALLTFTMCCDTDEEALAIQGPNFKTYSEAVRNLFAPWIDGKPPRSYEWFMKHSVEANKMAREVPLSEIVKAGGACIGSPETCLKVLQHLSDAGVDEALLFMQLYTTPHDKIMRAIELLAKEVMPKLKSKSK
ncbi:MAG TPA: LLM class flavin-dependent oxidoreductase [Candidatus Binataceae bacterium]|nr:LLM class flavin-dependent oxidoreductase [Candidatus Binataceae bacterium]